MCNVLRHISGSTQARIPASRWLTLAGLGPIAGK